jgi:hypothetical protein
MDEFFDWLSAGNATIINCNPLQGEFPPDWDYFEFIQRLEIHCKDKVVFPPLKHGVDCVFTQDKFAYLEKCSDICNPSYKIKCEWRKLSPHYTYQSWQLYLLEKVEDEIIDFASKYFERYNKGEGDPKFNFGGAILHNLFFAKLCIFYVETPRKFQIFSRTRTKAFHWVS